MVARVLDATTEVDLEEMCQTQSFCTKQESANTNQDGSPELMTEQSECAFPSGAQKTVVLQMTGPEGEWKNSKGRRRNLLLLTIPYSKLLGGDFEVT